MSRRRLLTFSFFSNCSMSFLQAKNLPRHQRLVGTWGRCGLHVWWLLRHPPPAPPLVKTAQLLLTYITTAPGQVTSSQLLKITIMLLLLFQFTACVNLWETSTVPQSVCSFTTVNTENWDWERHFQFRPVQAPHDLRSPACKSFTPWHSHPGHLKYWSINHLLWPRLHQLMSD